MGFYETFDYDAATLPEGGKGRFRRGSAVPYDVRGLVAGG